MLAELLYSKMYPVYILPLTNLYGRFDIARDIVTFRSAAKEAQRNGMGNSPLYAYAIVKYFLPSVEAVESRRQTSENTSRQRELTPPPKSRTESRQKRELTPPPKSRTVDSLPDLPKKIDSLPELPSLPEQPKKKGMFDDVTPKEQFLGNVDNYVHPKVKKQSSTSGGSVEKLKAGTSTVGSLSRISSSSFAITSNQNTPEIEV
jgi:hypothetical protein